VPPLARFDLKKESMDETAAACRETGRERLAARVDVSNSASAAAAVEEALGSHGGACYGLVTTRASRRDGLLMRMSDEDIRRVLAVKN